ncbi:histidine kinase [Mucilaginibacter sp. dw_454]|uniref:sensor histidine kinase n=1 Tax=Mucilaginibacter sp. dw_454 TaxID=2720079 RepID=UPI001BD4567C|nr:histidine kinase [Mucilaginibacter sp. dw_454]
MGLFRKNNVFILVHLLCWLILAVGVLYNHPSDWGEHIPKSFWIRQTVLFIILIVVFYINLYVLIPRLLFKEQVLWYGTSAVFLIGAVTSLNSLITSVFNLNAFFSVLPHRPGMPPFNHGGHPPHGVFFDIFVPGINTLMVGLGITISFIQKWQQEVALRQRLEQEKISAELAILKAQINPHFFFNTLNNIYAYTLSDGNVARTAITNLSKMMRYVLYEAAGGQAPLAKEIAFISEYTELMKLRISNKTSIQLELPQQTGNETVAPMLFLPFVENAFKHGVSGIDEGSILIRITQQQGLIELLVKNTIYQNKRASEDESNGIGIANTTRRLDLLYPGRYELTTGVNNLAEFEVRLILKS